MVSVASGQHWLRLATIAAGVTTGVLLDLIIIFEIDLDGVESIPGRLTAASAILATCGSLALLILARFHRRIDLEGPGAAALQMTIVCPRCRKRQRVAVGSSTCCRCDLRLHIRVEEPRCPKCEYLLYGIESDRCPECGQELARAGGDE